MKTLSNGVYTAIIVIGQLSLCVAQSDQSISLKVNSLTVKDFPDTEAVFKILEQGNIAFWITGKSKPTWDDVKELMEVTGTEEGEEIPEYGYFHYIQVTMLEFRNDYDGKTVSFFIKGENFETGISRYILSMKYDDFKKIVKNKYTFEIDF